MKKQPVDGCAFEILPPPTPELNKELAYREDARPLGEFLEWLFDHYGNKEMCELPPIEALLAEYFEIDLQKCENERRLLLAYQRILNIRSTEMNELRSLGVLRRDG